jgi:hypothetical protein
MIERTPLTISHVLRIRETRSPHAVSTTQFHDMFDPAAWLRA